MYELGQRGGCDEEIEKTEYESVQATVIISLTNKIEKTSTDIIERLALLTTQYAPSPGETRDSKIQTDTSAIEWRCFDTAAEFFFAVVVAVPFAAPIVLVVAVVGSPYQGCGTKLDALVTAGTTLLVVPASYLFDVGASCVVVSEGCHTIMVESPGSSGLVVEGQFDEVNQHSVKGCWES